MATQMVSKQTRKNWWIDAVLLISAIVAVLSGIYFLFLPVGGYQGGRNPLYNAQILFARATWDDLHTWGGVTMISAVLIHLTIHWPWVTSMARRTWAGLTRKSGTLNAHGRWNLILNTVVAVSFILTALSGVYFLFFPGGHQAAGPLILFSRTTWDLIHTWAGVVFTSAAILHFVIHWRWITNVTKKMARMLITSPTADPSAPAAKA